MPTLSNTKSPVRKVAQSLVTDARIHVSLIRSQFLLMTLSTDIRDFLADEQIVKKIVKELNEEIALCVTLRNLQREQLCNVIQEKVILFSDLGAEDRNEVYVYLGRALESILTCVLAAKFDVKRDRTSSGDISRIS